MSTKKHNNSFSLAPEMIIFDLEGTLLKTNYRLDDGKVAPSAWTLLAEKIGKECFVEEQKTKDKWLNGEYTDYVHWMIDTINIHKKYGLNKKIFFDVIDQAELMPGARRLIQYFSNKQTKFVIITGGFKALSDKVQKELKIDHALSGCEYFFDDKTGLISHFNLLPSDEEGKAHLLNSIFKFYNANRKLCVFIGDGKNDIHLAKSVGFSIAFNGQKELIENTSESIVQEKGKENLFDAAKLIDKYIYEENKKYNDMRENWLSNLMSINNTKKRNLYIDLLGQAYNSMERAYTPYSKFKVGAAVSSVNREIYSGCNIENASFGATICAERVAISKLIEAGHRKIEALAVIAAYEEPIPPCGICRQFISEFGSEIPIIMSDLAGNLRISDISSMLPGIFNLNKLRDL